MSSKNITIGIDLGDRRHAVCVLSAAGDILAETEVTNTRECLLAFAQQHPGATCVMETGTHSPWISRLLESLGHKTGLRRQVLTLDNGWSAKLLSQDSRPDVIAPS